MNSCNSSWWLRISALLSLKRSASLWLASSVFSLKVFKTTEAFSLTWAAMRLLVVTSDTALGCASFHVFSAPISIPCSSFAVFNVVMSFSNPWTFASVLSSLSLIDISSDLTNTLNWSGSGFAACRDSSVANVSGTAARSCSPFLRSGSPVSDFSSTSKRSVKGLAAAFTSLRVSVLSIRLGTRADTASTSSSLRFVWSCFSSICFLSSLNSFSRSLMIWSRSFLRYAISIAWVASLASRVLLTPAVIWCAIALLLSFRFRKDCMVIGVLSVTRLFTSAGRRRVLKSVAGSIEGAGGAWWVGVDAPLPMLLVDWTRVLWRLWYWGPSGLYWSEASLGPVGTFAIPA